MTQPYISGSTKLKVFRTYNKTRRAVEELNDVADAGLRRLREVWLQPLRPTL